MALQVQLIAIETSSYLEAIMQHALNQRVEMTARRSEGEEISSGKEGENGEQYLRVLR